MKPYSIYISGVGGQGIIKTSIVIGEAAMKMGMPVVMSEIHGMAQRGGVVSTELKIGSARSPIIPLGDADLLVAFEPLEALRAIDKISQYGLVSKNNGPVSKNGPVSNDDYVGKNGYVVTNTAPIMPFNISASENPYPEISLILEELGSKSKELFALDALKIAQEAGHILSLNMVMLGGAAAVPGFPVDKEMLMDSMKDNLPEKSLPINLKAFEEGFRAVFDKI